MKDKILIEKDSFESCPLNHDGFAFLILPPSERSRRLDQMLAFYERNNLSPMKEIFIEQAELAVDTYF